MITIEIPTPAARKLRRFLAEGPAVSDESMVKLIWTIDDALAEKQTAPWRKVVGTGTTVSSYYEELECGHRRHQYGAIVTTATRRRCKDCL